MKNRPQAKDYPDEPILAFLSKQTSPATWFEDFGIMPSVRAVFPPGTPEKVILAKMRSLIWRGLVEGCGCGCRGDFRIKEKA